MRSRYDCRLPVELKTCSIEIRHCCHDEFEGAAPAAMETSEAGGSWRGLARSGYGCARNKQMRATMGDSRTCPRRLSTWPRLQANETWHGDTTGSAKQKGTVRCDMEGMAEQTDVLRVSSQGESMEQCWAWPLASCSA